jgi:signal transduction histidine kinase
VAVRAITVSGGREIGTLLVAVSADPLDAAVQQVRSETYAAAAIAALGAGLVGGLLGLSIRRRLRRVASAVRAVGSGEPAQLEALPTRGAWGVARQALAVAADSVERRLDEARGRAEHLYAVLASLNEGVIVADAQRRVMLINPAARSLLNLPAGAHGETPVGLFTDELVPPSERVIRSYSATVRDEAGELLGAVTVLRDATRDQELDRLKSEFLAVVSHELQTPLTSIKGALELVLEDDTGSLSRVQRRFLDTIDRNSARLVGLVGDLLDLSRLEAGRLELDPQPLDTPSLVRGALAAVSNLFEARATEVRVAVADDVPPIYGDRRRVEQILTNLLTNAAKYTPAGGAVEVAAWSENGHVALAVADTGPGVPAVEREMVFDKFYRGRDAQRRGEAGSGLGLAIVKSLVELHGGQIRVEDSLPRGAKFIVELPRASDED